MAHQPELVTDCMADLVGFTNRDDVPVLMQCAIAHAQFETIHPVADGNGRCGRALVIEQTTGRTVGKAS
ncbi:Fic family protein [Bifidobacterium sp. CP2]|uniref:Fic family protein n=1 Tax=Bifidobacterium sp. CP2 TaxID=2809025 RepID=UPI001BDC7866|nr:Fic family protein [Bifidobacterium sp. CP2]